MIAAWWAVERYGRVRMAILRVGFVLGLIAWFALGVVALVVAGVLIWTAL